MVEGELPIKRGQRSLFDYTESLNSAASLWSREPCIPGTWKKYYHFVILPEKVMQQIFLAFRNSIQV